MTLNILYAGNPALRDDFTGPIEQACAEKGFDVRIAPAMVPRDVDYIVYAPDGPVQDFTAFTNCKAVMSLWAGVEKIIGNETLTQPLTRMVDEGLAQGMAEWVTGHVLRHHLGTDLDVLREVGDWTPRTPPLARERPVTILGLGELGQSAAHMLRGIGFPVTGWSRTQKEVEGVRCLSGDDGLREALASGLILVLLLPDTPATQNILNPETLALLPEGAVVLNPGRGTLIDDDALIAALDLGLLSHATLDVFRQEPLPEHHPYWTHPRVTVTPHIAAESRPTTTAQVIAENIRRSQAGETLKYLVDRKVGY